VRLASARESCEAALAEASERVAAQVKAAEAAAARTLEQLNAQVTAGMKAADEAVARLSKQTDSQIRSAADAATARFQENLRSAEAAASTARERFEAKVAESVAKAEANMAKLAEQAETSRAAVEEATRQAVVWQEGALQGAGSAGTAIIEGMTEARHEIGAFMSERIRQDMEAQAELLGCRSLDEMRAVQMRFFRGAVDQYSAEAARMMKLGTEIMNRALAR
jgi:hypothetical protein